MREQSKRLAAALRSVESPGVTTIGDDWPVFWESAHNSTVIDADGNHYIDMTAAFGVMSVGHANPRVVAAIQEQAPILIHGMGDVHPPAIKVALLEALSAVVPKGLNKTVLGLNGSDAVEAALKCAQIVTGRPGVIAFDGAYHGLSYGALSVTARADFRDPFTDRLAVQTEFLPFPTHSFQIDDVLARISSLSREQPIGAVIIEPIQGRGGVRVPAPGFLTQLRKTCDKHGLLLIVDEIFTGLGRTGDWFAVNHEAVMPDLLCLGKALGGGMPVSACIGGETSIEKWPTVQGEALHTSTFLGHPLSCAAALAALTEIQNQSLVDRAAYLGELVMARLESCPAIQVRGRGLMVGVVTESGNRAHHVVQQALNRGLILLPSGSQGEVISLTPPLTILEDTLERALDTLLACLHETPASLS